MQEGEVPVPGPAGKTPGDEGAGIDDPGPVAGVRGMFEGGTGRIAGALLAVQALLFALALGAGWHFYQATEPLAAIKWGISAATLLLVALQLKLALIPLMQTRLLLRALARLEQRLRPGR